MWRAGAGSEFTSPCRPGGRYALSKLVLMWVLQGQAVGNAPCLTVYDAGTGAEVRRIGEGHFAYSFEPNMMAVE